MTCYIIMILCFVIRVNQVSSEVFYEEYLKKKGSNHEKILKSKSLLKTTDVKIVINFINWQEEDFISIRNLGDPNCGHSESQYFFENKVKKSFSEGKESIFDYNQNCKQEFINKMY